METVILLLLSAVAQLVVPAPHSSTAPAARFNLNHVIEEAHKYNRTFANEFFVEDVEELVDAGCKDDFFCKVHNILNIHEKFEETKKDELILVRYLKAYITSSKINCTEVLKTVTRSTVSKPITVLLENIVKCSRKRNLGVK